MIAIFVLVIIAMLGASILNFSSIVHGKPPGYGISAELATRNWKYGILAVLIILAINIKYDWFIYNRKVIGGIGIGNNIINYYMEYHSPVNAIGAFENYLLAIGWIAWGCSSSTIHKEAKC